MKFYHFSQNNSGGSFHIDESAGIGCNVFVEAYDAVHANARAQTLGIYFDGVSKDMDCECCGDRWYETYDSDSAENVSEASDYYRSGAFVHHLDGRIEKL